MSSTKLGINETIYHSYRVVEGGIENVSHAQLLELAYSRKAVQERIAVKLILSQSDLEKYEDILVHIFSNGTGDQGVLWNIGTALSDYVPKDEGNLLEVIRYCKKSFRRQVRNGWYIASNIAKNGQYPDLNAFLLDLLEAHKISTEFQILMIHHGSKIFRSKWKELLRDNLDFTDLIVNETWQREVEGEDSGLREINIDLKTREEQVKGALFAHIVGDVLGAPVELLKSKEIQDSFGTVEDSVRYKYDPLPSGEYTDDSCLAFIGMDSILSRKNFDPVDYARRLGEQAAMMDSGEDMDRHFSSPTVMNMRRLQLGQDPRLSGQKSGKNGSAIRVLPIVILDLFDPEDNLRANVEKACEPTHTDEVSKEGAYLLALALRNCFDLDGQDPSGIIDLLIDECKIDLIKHKLELVRDLLAANVSMEDAAAQIGTRGAIEESVPFALFCFLKYPKDLKKVIVSAINIDGDSDSIAAMAGSLSGALNGYGAIPPGWIEKLNCRDKVEGYFQD